MARGICPHTGTTKSEFGDIMTWMAKNSVPEAPGRVLADLRKMADKQGLTAYALAKITGHSVSTCHRVLNSEVSPSLATVEAIAKALDLVIKIEKESR